MAKRILIQAIIALCFSTSLYAETISFVNENVKALCLANWDTDKDGELSTEEAEAVTTLGEVFRGKKNIGCFPELRYFTGLTTIAEYAFSGSSIGPEIVIPGNVKQLEAYCFSDCQQLNRVILEEGVESVGYDAFFGPVVYLSLPATLTYIASTAINPYVNAYPGSGVFVPKGDLTVQVHSEIPATIDNYAFYYVFGEAHLVVPQGCKEAYKSSSPWSHFYEYLEMGDVNDDGYMDITDVTALIAYVTGQDPKPFKPAAADINGDGLVDANDVDALCRLLLQ